MNDLIFTSDDCHPPTCCGCYLWKVLFLLVLLGHIADGMTIDFIFYHDTIVPLLVIWRLIWFLPWHNCAGSIRYFYCQYFGGLWPRTALHWHRACYLVWGTISLGVVPFSFGGAAQAVIWGAPPWNAPSWRRLTWNCLCFNVYCFVAVSVFWFGSVFFCFKRCSDEPEIKIHYHSVLAMGIALS